MSFFHSLIQYSESVFRSFLDVFYARLPRFRRSACQSGGAYHGTSTDEVMETLTTEETMATTVMEAASMTVMTTPARVTTPKIMSGQETVENLFYAIEKSRNVTTRKKNSRYHLNARKRMYSFGSTENSPLLDSPYESVRRHLDFSNHSLDTTAVYSVIPGVNDSESQQLSLSHNEETSSVVASGIFDPTQALRSTYSPRKKKTDKFVEGVLKDIVDDKIFSYILSFLDQGEILTNISLVCPSWADAASKALCTLMLKSVGCPPPENSLPNDDDYAAIDAHESDAVTGNKHGFPSIISSVSKSIERDWSYIVNFFPHGEFLSEGAFKKVFRVWNKLYGDYEAVSVM